jgi:hypothetical protein
LPGVVRKGVRWPILAATLVAAVVLVPAVAAAADGEWSLSVTPGFATFTVNQTVAGHGVDRTGTGAALTLDGQRAFGDTFALRAAVGGGGLSAAGRGAWAGTASVALVYVVDVLRYVPYVSVGGGLLAVGGGAIESDVRGVLELGVGIEVEESPSFAWGIDARLGSFVTTATVFTIGPRLAWKWGYF